MNSSNLIFALLKSYYFFLIVHNPTAIKRQKPILGRNKTLSATTKPTVKNKFEAGKNENVARARDRDKIFDTGS